MSGYKGKASNSGAQRVQAPNKTGGRPKGGRVLQGEDLRTKRPTGDK